MKRILIVEDQEYPLEALELAVKKVMPKYFSGFTKRNYDVAKYYNKAEELIRQSNYDIVILDHRMPREDPGITDLDETKDPDQFFKTLRNIGYGLIPLIRGKNRKTVIIGTSSMAGEIVGEKPDFQMRKVYGDAEKDLEGTLRKILTDKDN